MSQTGQTTITAPRLIETYTSLGIEGSPRQRVLQHLPERLFGGSRREQLPQIRQTDASALQEVRNRLAFVSAESSGDGALIEQTPRTELSPNQRRNMEHVAMMVERQIQFSKDYPETGPLHMLFNGTTVKETLEFIGGTALEMFSGTVTWWGPGDLVSLGEAALGRTIFGEKLSDWERVGEVVAAAIPFVPAYPLIKIYRLLRLPVEAAALPKVMAQIAQSKSANPRETFLSIGSTLNRINHPNDPEYEKALQIATNRLFPQSTPSVSPETVVDA